MKGDAVEHLDLGPALDDQTLHHVEAVQFPSLRGDLGQIPPRRWGGAPVAFPSVQDPPPFEDAVNGPHRGEGFDLAGLEGFKDGLRPMEPEIAGLLQLAPHGQDLILEGDFGPCGRRRDAGTIVPIDRPPLGPPRTRTAAHVELLGDLVLRPATSNGGDEGSAASGLRITLLMATSGKGCGFSCEDTPD